MSFPLIFVSDYPVSGKFSPDAYIQMVLQLAWYKTRGEFTATYETVLTRMFKRGRTETLRSYTRDSREFVLSMVDPRVSVRPPFPPIELSLPPATSLPLATSSYTMPYRHIRDSREKRRQDAALIGISLDCT